jgi:biotin transport system substrate-specific component
MTTLAPTLSCRYFPKISSRSRDRLLILLGSLLVALFARIEIPLPFSPIPITGQTFAVLLVGAALGAKRGAAAMVVYILQGVLGMPVFAGGASGLGILTGATAGYLAGFVIAAYVVGSIAERGLERSVRTSLIPFAIGMLIIYICGVSWLSIVMGSFPKALAAGLVPFLIGDALKLIAAATALPAAWNLSGR